MDPLNSRSYVSDLPHNLSIAGLPGGIPVILHNVSTYDRVV